MADATPRRRDRLRAETSAEIKTIALKHLSANGADAISLRAIAREMGMTAGAIYSYYTNRDELITALITDVYGALADAMEAAYENVPPRDPAARVLAVGQAYRQWALANPEEFRLIYGDPVPGYQPPDGGAAKAEEARACTVLLRLVEAGWPHAAAAHSGGVRHEWTDFGPSFASRVNELFPDLPPAAAALSMRTWSRMHGQVALELYGHLRPQLQEPGKLYLSEMLDLTRTLGFTPPTVKA
jgi:AcrR family transcriptional regulator